MMEFVDQSLSVSSSCCSPLILPWNTDSGPDQTGRSAWSRGSPRMLALCPSKRVHLASSLELGRMAKSSVLKIPHPRRYFPGHLCKDCGRAIQAHFLPKKWLATVPMATSQIRVIGGQSVRMLPNALSCHILERTASRCSPSWAI